MENKMTISLTDEELAQVEGGLSITKQVLLNGITFNTRITIQDSVFSHADGKNEPGHNEPFINGGGNGSLI